MHWTSVAYIHVLFQFQSISVPSLWRQDYHPHLHPQGSDFYGPDTQQHPKLLGPALGGSYSVSQMKDNEAQRRGRTGILMGK